MINNDSNGSEAFLGGLQDGVKHKDSAYRGSWIQGDQPPETGVRSLTAALQQLEQPLILVDTPSGLAVAQGGQVCLGAVPASTASGFPLAAWVPSLTPNSFGHAAFKAAHGLKYAYIIGAMANGITSTQMVETAARGGLMAYFGAAGLEPVDIERAITVLQSRLTQLPYGFNLIHSPNDPALEDATVNLYLKHAVRRISASAYINLTRPLVAYRVRGLHRLPDGTIVCPNKIAAKVSRVEVAQRFLAPPPPKLIKQLLVQGAISAEEAQLAPQILMADSITAEADSGGHTDNRPALALFPTILALRNTLLEKYACQQPVFVGLAGGIATPQAAAAAFAMGADYVLAGSVHQACIEAGTTPVVRTMLAQAGQADVTMAPAADMFEMGVKVQVLKRGTMFPQRATRLYELYCTCNTLEDIPPKVRDQLERDYFGASLEEVWASTRSYFEQRDPAQIQRAETDPRHKMALIFRAYLGQSSRWATNGDPRRVLDYQIWCGPAMGAFNTWVKGSFLEAPEARDSLNVALNILTGAAVVTRAAWLRAQGIRLPWQVENYRPVRLV